MAQKLVTFYIKIGTLYTKIRTFYTKIRTFYIKTGTFYIKIPTLGLPKLLKTQLLTKMTGFYGQMFPCVASNGVQAGPPHGIRVVMKPGLK